VRCGLEPRRHHSIRLIIKARIEVKQCFSTDVGLSPATSATAVLAVPRDKTVIFTGGFGPMKVDLAKEASRMAGYPEGIWDTMYLSTNLTIYGHYMCNGTFFTKLTNYRRTEAGSRKTARRFYHQSSLLLG